MMVVTKIPWGYNPHAPLSVVSFPCFDIARPDDPSDPSRVEIRDVNGALITSIRVGPDGTVTVAATVTHTPGGPE